MTRLASFTAVIFVLLPVAYSTLSLEMFSRSGTGSQPRIHYLLDRKAEECKAGREQCDEKAGGEYPPPRAVVESELLRPVKYRSPADRFQVSDAKELQSSYEDE